VAAAVQHAALEPMAGSTSRMIAADRLLGLLSQTMGDMDQATAHFDDALAFCRPAHFTWRTLISDGPIYEGQISGTCQDERKAPTFRARASYKT